MTKPFKSPKSLMAFVYSLFLIALTADSLFAVGSTSTSLTSSPNPSTSGTSVTFTATVTPSNAKGTVTFYDGDAPIGVGTLSGGRAVLIAPALAKGVHYVTASYGGDGSFDGSASPALVIGGPVGTTTTLTSGPNPSTFGTPVTFVASVSNGYCMKPGNPPHLGPCGPTPTGTVKFYNGGTLIASGTLSEPSGTISMTTSALPAGADSITAAYQGDAYNYGSTSSPLTQTVNKATPTITWSNPSPITYGTALSSTQLNATANVQGAFSYSPASGTVLNAGNNQTLSTTFTPNDTTDYNTATANVALTVNPAGLTITASSGSMSYGGTPPTVTPSYSGFVNGDTAASLTTQPTCSTTATSSSPAGNYPTSCSGAVDGNYTISYQNGTMQVAPVITGLTPAWGPIGTLVTIAGGGFGSQQGAGSVVLGTTSGRMVSWSDTLVTAIVAPDSASGIAQITQNGVASAPSTFTISTPTIANVTPVSASVGTSVTIDGSGFGPEQGTSQVNLGTKYGTVVSWSDTEVIATVAPGSMSGTAQILEGGGASNSVSFAVVPPAVASISPASGAAGTQVTIVGSGFGAAQGSGKVVLGTAYAAIVSWSDSQVVATVPLGSSSGVAQVWQGGVGSNTESFTIPTPTLTGVSPASGGAGTQVTVTGSGFGATQGSGAVWLGSGYATVVSWGDTQIVATVAPDSASGVAQVLQNGIWSNSLAFSTLRPQITSINPTSGVAGTSVTIAGSGFGASKGSGILMLGSVAGIVTSWTDAQVVATVAPNALTGSVRIQQNGIWSNAIRFIVPTNGSGLNNTTIVPNMFTMLIGETRTLQALSSTGAPEQGLAWTSSDPTVASLSSDDPPVITALAAGHVTITAGDSSSDVTVYAGSALPTGTVIWSAPGDGTGVSQILPAVPSPTGAADTFALNSSGNVQAITSEGTVAWTANASQADLIPDFQGGLATSVGSAGGSVTRLDGITGQATPLYTYAVYQATNVGVHTDGTIFTADGGTLVGLDPANGPKFNIALENSTDTWTDHCGGQSGQDSGPAYINGNLVIAGDGFAYLFYEYHESSVTYDMGSFGCQTTSLYTLHYRLLRVSSDGTAQKIVISDWPVARTVTPSNSTTVITTSGTMPDSSPRGTLVTNADAGVMLAVNYELEAYCPTSINYGCSSPVPGETVHRLVTVSGGNIASDVTMNLTTPYYNPVVPILQAENGTYFGTGASGANSMDNFDTSGNVNWSVPGGFTPVMATADGGVIAKSSGGQYVTFDQNGVADGMLASLSTYSWTGNWYGDLGGPVSMVSLPPADVDGGSFWPVAGANPSATGTAVAQCPCVLQAPLLTSSISSRPRVKLANYLSSSAHFVIPGLNRDSRPMLAPGPSGGTQEYVILAGDPGRNNGPGRNWNVGNLFNLAAQTQSDSLTALGDSVIIDRVTYVQSGTNSVENSLTTNGIIDGGVIYFGHAGDIRINGEVYPALFIGQDPVFDENLSALNASALTNSQLGPNATITLNACHAGSGAGGKTSVAQSLADQLRRRVYAYNVGVFFSTNPTARIPSQTPLPNNTPIYMVPWNGAPLLEFDPK